MPLALLGRLALKLVLVPAEEGVTHTLSSLPAYMAACTLVVQSTGYAPLSLAPNTVLVLPGACALMVTFTLLSAAEGAFWQEVRPATASMSIKLILFIACSVLEFERIVFVRGVDAVLKQQGLHFHVHLFGAR